MEDQRVEAACVRLMKVLSKVKARVGGALEDGRRYLKDMWSRFPIPLSLMRNDLSGSLIGMLIGSPSSSPVAELNLSFSGVGERIAKALTIYVTTSDMYLFAKL